MTSRERVTRTLKFENPDRVPRNLWTLPSVNRYCEENLVALHEQFPMDIGGPKVSYGASPRVKGQPYEIGSNVDAWGSVWHVAEYGVIGEVKDYPIRTWDDLDSYKLPWELLDGADFSEVNKSCAESDAFILAGTETRPFERMQFVRGTENLFLDLAYGEPGAYKLRDMLHEFYVREMRMWAATDVDAIMFMDDWGTQTSLLISPDKWREFYKPLYKEYCDIIRASGKFVFFHSDGFTEAIYPDLIEMGVSAFNSQLFCMDIEGLGEKYKGKITFWGEMDRQNILPFANTNDVRNAVKRVRKSLDTGKGGVIAQCEWQAKDPFENIIALYDEWCEPL